MRVRKHGYPLLAETCSELRGSRDCAAQPLTDSLRPRLGLTEQVIRGVEDQTAAIQVEITQIGLTIPLVDHNLQTAPEIACLDATNGRVHTVQHGDLISAVVHFGNQNGVREIIRLELDGSLIVKPIPVTVLFVDGDKVLGLTGMD